MLSNERGGGWVRKEGSDCNTSEEGVLSIRLTLQAPVEEEDREMGPDLSTGAQVEGLKMENITVRLAPRSEHSGTSVDSRSVRAK